MTLAVMVAGGCGPVAGNDESGTTDTTGSPTSTTSGTTEPGSTGGASSGSTAAADDDTTAADSTTGTTSAGETSPPVIFDLSTVPDVPSNGRDVGCSEVDFLYVIDNSLGMEEAQAKLLDSAPAFVDTVRDLLPDVERFHVGVITSDAYAGNEPSCTDLGNFVTQTSGPGALGEVCSFEDGHRFATEADDLDAAFSCMAQVGTGGSVLEQPVTATIAALDQSLNAWPCNAGFFGEGSVVVIVVLTDDTPSEQDDDANLEAPGAPSWATTVSNIVHEYSTAVVTIGLVPSGDVSCTGAESPNLINFVTSFNGWDWGVLGSVCAPDYGVVFDEALFAVQNACESLSDQDCGGCPPP